MTDHARTNLAPQRRIPPSGLVAPVVVGRTGMMVLVSVPVTDPVAHSVAVTEAANDEKQSDGRV